MEPETILLWLTSGLVLATFALVGITAYYAIQTQRMVREMEKARAALVMPKLVPTVEKLGGSSMLPRIVNIGTGPALSVKLTLSLVPKGPSATYRAPIMTAGRGQSLLMKKADDAAEDSAYNDTVEDFERFEALVLVGEYADALGTDHQVSERFDLGPYLTAFKSGTWARATTVTKTGRSNEDLIAESLVNIEHLMRLSFERE